MLKKTLAALVLGSALVGGQAFAADYAIDKQGQHAFVNFKISHLGNFILRTHAKFIGEGDDPWGGCRAGFEGSTTLTLKDFDIKMDLGPASQTVDLIISVEGVRK